MSKLDSILNDIKRVYRERKTKNMAEHEYLKLGKFSKWDLFETGESFTTLKVKAGLLDKSRIEKRKVQFEEIDCKCDECKRPMTSQLDNNGIRLMRRCKQCKDTEEYAVAGSYFCDA